MKKHLISMIAGVVVGAVTFGAVGAYASTPKASAYCTKAEVGKVATYKTKSGAKRTVKCQKVPTYKYTWKLQGK